MKPMPNPLLFIALALAATDAVAATPAKSDAPADYAYALPLQVSGKQGVLALRLPQAVYLHARTAGLDDLRVFDSTGAAQPYALHRPPPPERLVKRDLLAANIFPVRSALRSAGGDSAIDFDIQTRPDGSVKSVRARTGKAQANDAAALTSLILDFGAAAKGSEDHPARIDALRFTAPRDHDNYSAEVWLETSGDLKRWETVGAAELRWLSNDNAQTLANDRLEFTARTFRYARLTWRRGEPTAFPTIDAELVTPQDNEPVRETLWVKPLPGKQAGDLTYPAGIALPVEQISLRLSEANIVYPMAIGYYIERPSRNLGSEWIFQPQAYTTFYQISQNGETRRSGALTISTGHHQEWVIRPQNVTAKAQPELGLSWQPTTLVFLAGGTPPYTLGFGRSDATPASQPLAQVAPGFTARELTQLEQAQTGELQTGSAAAGESAASLAGLAARNRSLILWGVLLLGVIILGAMAWRLVRQMKAGSDQGN